MVTIAAGRMMKEAEWRELCFSEMKPVEHYLPPSANYSGRFARVLTQLSWQGVTDSDNLSKRLVARIPLDFESKLPFNINVDVAKEYWHQGLEASIWLGQVCLDKYVLGTSATLLMDTYLPLTKDLLHPLMNQPCVLLTAPWLSEEDECAVLQQPLPDRVLVRGDCLHLSDALLSQIRSSKIQLVREPEHTLIWEAGRIYKATTSI